MRWLQIIDGMIFDVDYLENVWQKFKQFLERKTSRNNSIYCKIAFENFCNEFIYLSTVTCIYDTWRWSNIKEYFKKSNKNVAMLSPAEKRFI